MTGVILLGAAHRQEAPSAQIVLMSRSEEVVLQTKLRWYRPVGNPNWRPVDVRWREHVQAGVDVEFLYAVENRYGYYRAQMFSDA